MCVCAVTMHQMWYKQLRAVKDTEVPFTALSSLQLRSYLFEWGNQLIQFNDVCESVLGTLHMWSKGEEYSPGSEVYLPAGTRIGV